MKICFVHEEYPNETNFGGIATYQKIMAEGLAKVGHTVYVICRGLEREYQVIENGVHIYRIYVPQTNCQKQDEVVYRKKVCIKLKELQDKSQIEIIETPDWGANTFYFEAKRKVPLVVRLHTPLKIWLQYNKNNFGDVKESMLKWEEAMIQSCDCLTSCSSILKKLTYENYAIKNKQISVIPNPANLTNFYEDHKIKKDNILLFIGSLEERKGVLVLAQALNKILEIYPDIRMQWIGKDTVRNKYNISTKKVILDTIESKFHNRIEFVGQIENIELNAYLNRASVAIFPSLFDNFPYTVLEAMATGVQIVGSKNSGMIDMLDDTTSIYETGNVDSLIEKIIMKYELSKKEPISKNNMNRVKTLYSTTKICSEMLNIYQETIQKYQSFQSLKEKLENVLKVVFPNSTIKNILKEKNGVSNNVYRVYTQDYHIYIIKEYLYQYNFRLENQLYDIYESNCISVIRPINKEIIQYKDFQYNIFEYKKEENPIKTIPKTYILKLLNMERKVKTKETILYKCNKYYDYLSSSPVKHSEVKEEIDYVMYIYRKIKDYKLFKERYINHGDISKDNILYSENRYYIIDFDEVTITTPLYDFAVVIIKLCLKGDQIDQERCVYFMKEMQKKYSNYQVKDFKLMIVFYLCKILIEKFYLSEIGKIDLFSEEQLKDDYRKYLMIFQSIIEEGIWEIEL